MHRQELSIICQQTAFRCATEVACLSLILNPQSSILTFTTQNPQTAARHCLNRKTGECHGQTVVVSADIDEIVLAELHGGEVALQNLDGHGVQASMTVQSA